MVKAKVKPKPVIDYPPVPRKKWIPPDERPKPVREPAYVKPHGMNQRLNVSSLVKVWHKFRVYDDIAVLPGAYSQTHKKYRTKTNGFQGACNCVVAIVFSKIWKMEKWDSQLVNMILDMGDDLYVKSLTRLDDKSVTIMKMKQVYSSFFFGKSRMTFAVGLDVVRLAISIEQNRQEILTNALTSFLDTSVSGVLSAQKRHMAVWTYGANYYLFDSSEHAPDGQKWKQLPSLGHAIVAKFNSVRSLTDFIIADLTTNVTIKMLMYPVALLRMTEVNTQPPQTFEELKTLTRKDKEKEALLASKAAVRPPLKERIRPPHTGIQKPSNVPPEIKRKLEEISPDAISILNKPERVGQAELLTKRPSWLANIPILKHDVSQARIPKDKPQTKSVTHFTDLLAEFSGILRGSTHQTDIKFSRFNDGEQSPSQAVAALVMRRFLSSKQWLKSTVNDILKLGETIQHESLKLIGQGDPNQEGLQPAEHQLEGPFKLGNVMDKITFQDKEFSPDIDEYALLGKLGSDKEDVLDLLPALDSFLRTYDCCIVNGPLTLAIWYENGRFYMYDPNERDSHGRFVVKSGIIGEKTVRMRHEPGFACVTWFINLKELVDLYLDNTPKAQRKDNFHLSRVVIKDYLGLPEAWNNFKAIDSGKWILRGTFSQAHHRFKSDSRNAQCTANAVMAIAFYSLRPLEEWNTETVDEVLTNGDLFYRATVEHLKENSKYQHPHLMLDEVLRKYPYENQEVNFEIQDCLVNGLVGAKDESGDVINVKKGFMEFFKYNDSGVFTSHGISLSVCKKNEIYYYFDSHSRDPKGVVTGYGTACILRIQKVEDLAKAVEVNLGVGALRVYNIGAVGVQILEASQETGIAKQPLNNYSNIDETENVSILIARTSDKDPKFEYCAGKQSVPMCVTAMGMNKLRPSEGWSEDLLEIIMDVGNKYYEDCMAAYEASEDEVDEDMGITSERLVDKFKIGMNKLVVSVEKVQEGTVDSDLEPTIMGLFPTATTAETPSEEYILEMKRYNVALWKDANLYYLFDPHPRDSTGQIIGKDQWSAKIEIDYELDGEGESEGDILAGRGQGDAGAATITTPATPAPSSARTETGGTSVSPPTTTEEAPVSEAEPIPQEPSYVSGFDLDGKACILRFYKLEDLFNHIYDNTRPNRRTYTPFVLSKVTIDNQPEVKQVFDKQVQDREDVYAGNWYEFEEVEYGKWILRGSLDLESQTFPEANRGNQQIPCNFAALSFAYLYSLAKFKPANVNTIVGYGDRLLTFTRRERIKQLKANTSLGLSEEEIETIVAQEKYEILDYVNKFVVGDHKLTVNVELQNVIGDIKAGNHPNVLNVERGLEKFFQTCQFGILECKDYAVAVWKGETVYYMFDAHRIGPNGIKEQVGAACITRFLTLDKLAETFLANIPQLGNNFFCIHKVEVSKTTYDRPRQPSLPEKTQKPTKVTGYVVVIPGKTILRGSLNQESPKFGRGPNVLSSPIAYIALTMTLIHKPATWSRPIVDEIVRLGEELYVETTNRLSFDFNPWEDQLDPYRVNKDYRIGVMRANCELMNTDQRGYIDVKDPCILNLRQGIERFFDENTHGILFSHNIIYAIWEEEEEDGTPVIYMFDPNPRGSTGLPSPQGTACVVTFLNSKLAFDHIVSCTVDPDEKNQEFVIIPLEIVVGPFKTKKKTKKPKEKCDLKNENMARHLAHQCLAEDQKLQKKKATEARKKAEAKRLFWQGRTGYVDLVHGEAILRGLRSQNSLCYPESSRGYQDIPNCIVAFVTNCIVPISDWTHKEIDVVLDVGNQLYIDSYITYQPTEKKLGLLNVLRNIFVMNKKAHVTIFRPNVFSPFNPKAVANLLEKFFLRENFCLFKYMDQYVAIFFKKGFYFLFDPHARNIHGHKTKSETDDAACVLKFDNLVDLGKKLVCMLSPDNLEVADNHYSLVLVRLEGGICQCVDDDVNMQSGVGKSKRPSSRNTTVLYKS